MPRRPEQFEAIREKSRGKILSAALELFARNGYDSTSVEGIAKKARISKGLIYNYYKSKKEVLLAIFDDAIQQGHALVKRHEGLKDSNARTRAIIEEAFGFMYNNPEYLKLMFVLSLQPGVLKQTKDYTDKMYRTNQEFIGSLYNKGDGEQAYTGLMLDALLDGIMLNFIRYGDKYPVNELKKRIIEAYCTPNKGRKKI